MTRTIPSWGSWVAIVPVADGRRVVSSKQNPVVGKALEDHKWEHETPCMGHCANLLNGFASEHLLLIV